MKLVPLQDKVVVKMVEVEETTKSGLILTGTAKEKPQVAEVLAVGPGIAEGAQAHIFDKFYQQDSSHKEEGNGLGLALVRQIVELSGGTVRCENIDTGGCRLTVTLPTE